MALESCPGVDGNAGQRWRHLCRSRRQRWRRRPRLN